MRRATSSKESRPDVSLGIYMLAVFKRYWRGYYRDKCTLSLVAASGHPAASRHTKISQNLSKLRYNATVSLSIQYTNKSELSTIHHPPISKQLSSMQGMPDARHTKNWANNKCQIYLSVHFP